MESLIPIFAIFFVIGVPVMSIAAKFVLQPMLRELTASIRGGKQEDLEELRERLANLEGRLSSQGDQLDRLVEAELFRRRLEAGPADVTTGAPDVAAGAPADRDRLEG